MKRSLAWSWPITRSLSTLALGAALAAEPASLSGDGSARQSAARPSISTSRGLSCPSAMPPATEMSGKMSTIAASLSRGDGSSDRGKWWVGKD